MLTGSLVFDDVKEDLFPFLSGGSQLRVGNEGVIMEETGELCGFSKQLDARLASIKRSLAARRRKPLGKSGNRFASRRRHLSLCCSMPTRNPEDRVALQMESPLIGSLAIWTTRMLLFDRP